MGHGVTVGAQGHQVSLGIHLSFVLREGLDVVDLDVAVRVGFAVGLIEVELADRTGGSVYLYREPAVLRASLIRAVLAQALTPLSVGEDPLVDLSVSDLVAACEPRPVAPPRPWLWRLRRPR